MDLSSLIQQAVSAVREWEATWGGFSRHSSLDVSEGELEKALAAYATRLHDNYPFFHPRYAGQMLKPPHPAAIAAYVAAQCINPNNHALDGGPATGAMEKEVVVELSKMVGFPADSMGHLTSSGTIANLEALWIARSLHPGRAVAFSAEAHYTHARMSEVLGVETRTVPTDPSGRMDPDALIRALDDGKVGTVVATAGTTGLGAVDPVADLLPIVRERDVRLHVDGAYGGFYRVLVDDPSAALDPETRRHLRAIDGVDSVVIDPHKHGLQPYGCGAVLFRDPAVGRFYKHDSPYTYFTSDDLHLGEISLECSRPGAAAGALWLTLQLFPLRRDEGLGPVLRACLRASQRWYGALSESEVLVPHLAPELDIVTFFPRVTPFRASMVDRMSQSVLERAMTDADDPIFLSVLKAPAGRLHMDGHLARKDRTEARVLRSVLMKPEHEAYVDRLHERVTQIAESVVSELSGV